MKCPQCKKDFEAAVKAAYKLGLLDGENRVRRSKNINVAANHALFYELQRKDKREPLDDCCIRISRHEAEMMARKLHSNKQYHLAKKIRNMIKTQIITKVTLD